jgi:hypothetical protein
MYKLAWLVAAAALVFVTAAGAEQTYPDPEGDAGVRTDILAVKVANDPSGAITFTATGRGRMREPEPANVAAHASAVAPIRVLRPADMSVSRLSRPAR